METGTIVLEDDTPEVVVGGGSVSVRVQFTVTGDVASTTCALQDLVPLQDCESNNTTHPAISEPVISVWYIIFIHRLFRNISCHGTTN